MGEKNKEIIRILNIVPNMRAAGIESFIMNVYRKIDRNKVQFDFIVHNLEKNFYDNEIEQLGGRIYRLTFKDDKNIFKYIKDLNDFFKYHKEYKIVHGHMQSMMPLYLLIAKIHNIPVRIAHSHNGAYEKSIKGFILHLFSRLTKKFSTNNWACSKIAGQYLFGKDKFKVIYNGIDVSDYIYNEKNRKEIRKELNIENKLVLLHVGRFEKQKNHEYIIKIFEKLYLKNNDAILLLIGEGKLKEKIRRLVDEKRLTDKVLFLGIRNDVNKILQAADYFLLPSLYEGLPVVGIEAQYSKIKCLMSNTITSELKISDNIYFFDLMNELNDWVDEIKPYNRDEVTIIDDKIFDIRHIVQEITKQYERLYYGSIE